jgi:hypothetical protein
LMVNRLAVCKQEGDGLLLICSFSGDKLFMCQ